MDAMKIGIVGCAGRMGRMLVGQVLATDGVDLAGGTEQPGSEFAGQDLALLAGHAAAGIAIGDDTRTLFEACDTVIDFTVPAATAEHARLAGETGTALIVGTTGLEAAHQDAIRQTAGQVPVVQAANFSVGVNILLGLCQQAAATLGDDYDIEVVEMHHRHKVDAPSGTALALGEAAAAGRGVDLAEVSERVRDGHTGPRKTGDIGFATLRGGDVAGDHTVIFAGEGERLELTHKAGNRVVFASGAVRAALWTAGRPPGLYSMQDVLAPGS